MSTDEAVTATELAWFKSSYSSGAGGECVEVAMTGAAIHVRDSKQLPQGGPALTVDPSAWAEFLRGL